MSGLDNMKSRLSYEGGDLEGRVVKRKLQSMLSAQFNSYQGEWITLHGKKCRCLINPSRLTEQFDKKVISIEYESGIAEGDVFYWDRTGRYWQVDLQQHTEEAYFRGTITRCDTEIEINGHTYWAVKRGPDETSIDWRNKHKIYFNDLNYSILLELPKDSNTVNYFSRFNFVPIKLTYPDVDTGEEIVEVHRWQVVATDKYSSDRLIQVYLREHYDNPMEEAMAEIPTVEPDESKPYIAGPQIVNVYDTSIVYEIKNISGGRFVVNSNKVEIEKSNGTECVINVLTGKSSSFVLSYYMDSVTHYDLNVTIQSF